jgi:DNA-binding winged helix-turn-helix (wHTH) protein
LLQKLKNWQVPVKKALQNLQDLVAIKASNPSHIATVPREGFQLAAMKLSEVASNTQMWMCPKFSPWTL